MSLAASSAPNSAWGPQWLGGGRVRFRLWAPDRAAVTLEFRDGPSLAMESGADGWFELETEEQARTRYRFRLDEELAVPDPASRAQDGGVHGWSVLTELIPAGERDAAWKGRPWEEAVVMEVHAGVLGGFSGVAQRLPRWAEMGVTAIELMPVGAFGGRRNWGYDGVLPYAVAEAYGSTEDLVALIDLAHELGLMIMLDVVYNHFGPDGNYLGSYASPFLDQHADTPWGGAVAVSLAPVRRFFVDNALMWLRDYGFDGLRFDAVHAIGDSDFLDDMARELRSALPDRHIHLVLENEGNDAGRLKPGLYDAQWNDDFHNTLHVMLTGETEGYYEGFAENPTQRLARCLAEGFVYQGETPQGEDAHPRGTPSAHLPAKCFVSFLQNHDQVGNRAMGERLIHLTSEAKLRAATALLLLGPQIPLLFMGEEEGSRSPFLFFTDFPDELADAVRMGRRREFARFAAFADAQARERIPDPNAQGTFTASRPKRGDDADAWRAFYTKLLALRRQWIIPGLLGTTGQGCEVLGEGAVAARWRMGDGVELTIAINIGDAKVRFPDKGAPFFSLGQPGDPDSFAAWLTSGPQ